MKPKLKHFVTLQSNNLTCKEIQIFFFYLPPSKKKRKKNIAYNHRETVIGASRSNRLLMLADAAVPKPFRFAGLKQAASEFLSQELESGDGR